MFLLGETQRMRSLFRRAGALLQVRNFPTSLDFGPGKCFFFFVAGLVLQAFSLPAKTLAQAESTFACALKSWGPHGARPVGRLVTVKALKGLLERYFK